MKKKKFRRFLFFFIMFLLLVCAAATLYVRRVMLTPYKSYSEPKIAVTIVPGTPLDSIVKKLHQKGVIRHPWLLRAIFRWKQAEGKSKAGDYVFDRALTPLEVFEKLMKGEMFYTVITFPEGSSTFEIQMILDAKAIPGSAEFRKVLDSREVLSLLHLMDASIHGAEGFLFPETYFLSKRDDVPKLATMMIRQFGKRFGEAERKRTRELGFTTLQVITLASLIEKETGQDTERPLISGVFHNRLNRSMLLQCDPTVIYAMKVEGVYHGTILRRDLQRESPYNTYLYAGLPPGPICNPGEASIQAALYPQETSMLYFVSRNDGTHQFSATLQEHNQAVRQYRRN